MAKRTIFIILGALLFLALIALAWWWFLGWSSEERGPAEGLGSAEVQQGAAGSGNEQTNIGSTVGSGSVGTNNSTAGGGGSTINLGTVGPGGTSGGLQGGSSRGRTTIRSQTYTGSTNIQGVTWLPTGGSVSNFTPSQTNQLNDGSIGGQVSLLGTPPQPTSGVGLTTALAGVGIGTALCTAGFIPGLLGVGGAATIANSATAVRVADSVTNLGSADTAIRENFLNCITRTIARAAVQQITASTVNWINSGFNGKPAFVQNYQQFFTNVADQAAGEYIRGSALSFLCSPFGPKIRIALAQGYANRNAASCTLSRVSNNIQGFMNGNFGAGGWSGLLQFTTVPTNNPFGAYSYAEIGLATAQSNARTNAQARISPGGFLSQEECTTDSLGQKKCKIVTPGQTIETALSKALDTGPDMLKQAGISGSFDAIINALMQQMMVRALQGGVSNLSGLQGYENNFLTPDQQQAQARGNTLLSQLQGISNTAGQYGSVAQGSIADVQNAQSRLQQLVNCYETKAQADNATASQAQIATLEQKVTFYNDRITRANETIALLQGFQTRVLQVTTLAQVTAIQNDLTAAEAAGQLITTADLTTAQQDRTTLQSELASINNQTDASLTQCRAS